MKRINTYIIILIASVLTAILLSAEIFLMVGLFLGLTWFPARLLLFKEDRQFFTEVFDTHFLGSESEMERTPALILTFCISFIFNFFLALLFWPGLVVINLSEAIKRAIME